VEGTKIRADLNDWIAERQVRLDPKGAYNSAVEAQKSGKLGDAEILYRAILKRHRNDFRTLYNLAEVLVEANRPEEAIVCLRKALAQKPDSADAHLVLTRALRRLGRMTEALERVKRVIALNPQSGDAHAALAEILMELGRHDEARPIIAQAMERAPGKPVFYYQWGQFTRWSAGDPGIAALEALKEKSSSLRLEDRILIEFTLGKAYADCGDMERAFRCQIEGGALKRQSLVYDEAQIFGRWDALCRAFDAAAIARHAGAGAPSPRPIFILGMPRSGSTLIEQILASHPQLHALGERPIFEEALAKVRSLPTDAASLEALTAPWSDEELRRVGEHYLEAARREAPRDAARVADKVPLNFRYVGLIHAALPNARIIHTCRDPLDTCLSIFSILFTEAFQPYSYDLAELGRYHRAYQKTMAHWRSVLPPGVMIDVAYEDVVDDVETQARRIVAHCGLEWDDRCLEFYKTERPVLTASHAQVRQPIYRSSVGRARPPRELLLPLLEALGIEDPPD
jgi:tetratricopeptide (TPR) repeat protein